MTSPRRAATGAAARGPGGSHVDPRAPVAHGGVCAQPGAIGPAADAAISPRRQTLPHAARAYGTAANDPMACVAWNRTVGSRPQGHVRTDDPHGRDAGASPICTIASPNTPGGAASPVPGESPAGASDCAFLANFDPSPPAPGGASFSRHQSPQRHTAGGVHQRHTSHLPTQPPLPHRVPLQNPTAPQHAPHTQPPQGCPPESAYAPPIGADASLCDAHAAPTCVDEDASLYPASADDAVFAGLVSGLEEHQLLLLPFLDAPSPPPLPEHAHHHGRRVLRGAAPPAPKRLSMDSIRSPPGTPCTPDGSTDAVRRSVGGSAALFGPDAMVFASEDVATRASASLFGLPSWASVHAKAVSPPLKDSLAGDADKDAPSLGMQPRAQATAVGQAASQAAQVPFSVDDLFTGSIDSVPLVTSPSLFGASAASLPRRHSVASIFTGLEGRLGSLSVEGAAAAAGVAAPVPIPQPPRAAGTLGVARSPPSALSPAAAAFHFAPVRATMAPQLQALGARHYSLPRPYDAAAGCGMPPALPAARPAGPPLHLGTYRGALYAVEFKAGRTELFYVAEDTHELSDDGETPLSAAVGEYVIVEADRGEDLGRVVAEIPARRLRDLMTAMATDGDGQALASAVAAADSDEWMTPEIAAMLRGPPREVVPKRIHRHASASDLKMMHSKAQEEAIAMVRCQSRIRQKRLPMDVVDAEYQWDRNKLTFYFCAERRIDFRELVRDLFRIYKTRIWMCAVDRASPRVVAWASQPQTSAAQAAYAALAAAASDYDAAGSSGGDVGAADAADAFPGVAYDGDDDAYGGALFGAPFYGGAYSFGAAAPHPAAALPSFGSAPLRGARLAPIARPGAAEGDAMGREALPHTEL